MCKNTKRLMLKIYMQGNNIQEELYKKYTSQYLLEGVLK